MKKNNQIFVFMGPPGSGKGTLSSLCVSEFGWKQLSAGNLCRMHVQQNTDIGKKVKDLIECGQLVSDDIIIEMIKEGMKKSLASSQNIILDGYPRTKKQAEMLFELLEDVLQEFELVLIKLDINKHKLIERIISRVFCSNKDCQQSYSLSESSGAKPKHEMTCNNCQSVLMKRADDTQQTFEKRLQAYYEHEQEILDYYKNRGCFIKVLDGTGSIKDVFDTFNALTELNDHVGNDQN